MRALGLVCWALRGRDQTPQFARARAANRIGMRLGRAKSAAGQLSTPQAVESGRAPGVESGRATPGYPVESGRTLK